ncbi:hypothetical protein NPIL_315971 [Nephila pilipes]|uniref:Uncharacterized protein n=1 Tax=Nephila pilipes TaxID=299642 RepID=A0A8X6NG75_NEPPI|nr:hypothetical protein NPIL_315971 [Nephila pilipes]
MVARPSLFPRLTSDTYMSLVIRDALQFVYLEATFGLFFTMGLFFIGIMHSLWPQVNISRKLRFPKCSHSIIYPMIMLFSTSVNSCDIPNTATVTIQTSNPVSPLHIF